MDELTKQRDEIAEEVLRVFGTKPEFLWARDPHSCVFRREDTGKWFAVIMKVKREKIVMGATGEVMVIDLKCDPLMTGSILTNEGIYPAYHMNKKNWITVLLDGTVPTEEIMMLIDMSYQLGAPRQKTRQVMRTPYWIIPINNDYYDIEEAIERSPDKPLEWHQRYNFAQGDTAYLYVTAPTSAIKYKFHIDKVEILENEPKGRNKVVYMRFVRRYDESVFTFGRLKEYGVTAVRGPRTIPMGLVRAIEDYENEGN